MSDPIIGRIRAIAADLFLVPLQELTPESSPQNIENWDSMQHLNLALELEMTFGIKLTPAELDSMRNIASAAAVVRKKLDETGVA
jgi:acyl carrier protein